MKTRLLNSLLVIVFLASGICAYADPSISPAGPTTVCPNEAISYSFNANPGSSVTCSGNVTWTITKGSFDPNTSVLTKTAAYNTSVLAYWNNTAEIGTLTASVGCSSSTTITKTDSYSILSLTNRTLTQAASSTTRLPYCATSDVFVSVQQIQLLNTGGTTGVSQKYADGYEWSVPSGWTGSSDYEYITVSPSNGCVGGTLSVKAYMNCSTGKKYSSALTFNLNRQDYPLQVTAQSGYTGANCGNNTSITFTVTQPPGCLRVSPAAYQWNAPAGWYNGQQGGTTFFTSTNSITLTPSGNGSDAGQILCSVVLSCGTTLGATPYNVVYKLPVISEIDAICASGTAASLSNMSGSATATWAGNLITVASGQGTSSVILQQATAGVGGETTVTVTVSCASTSVASKDVFVGAPQNVMIIGDDIINEGQEKFYYMATYGLYNPNPNAYATFAEQHITNYEWAFVIATNPGWQYFNGSGAAYTWAMADANSQRLSARIQNGCGYSDYAYRDVFVYHPNCPPGGCEEPFSIYPNPSGDDLFISIRPGKGSPSGGGSSFIENTNGGSAQLPTLNQDGSIASQQYDVVNQSDSKYSSYKEDGIEKTVQSKVVIYDGNGNEVMNANHEGLNNKVSLKNLNNGTYYLRLNKDGKWYEKKIIVNH